MSLSSAQVSKRTKWADENLKNRRRRNRKSNQKQKLSAVCYSSSLRGCEIFENELVVGKILKDPSLSIVDLKKCRQVNSMWRREATKVLVRNHTTRKIILSGHSDSGYEDSLVFLDNSAGFEQFLDHIEVFTKFVEASHSTFPCNNFSISECNLTCDSVQRLLWEHGKKVKTLEIRKKIPGHPNVNKGTDIKFLELLLTEQAPNLQSLKFFGIPNQWKNSPFLETSTLRSLTKIYFRHFDAESSPFLEKILRAGGNLKSAKSLDVFSSNTIFANAVASYGRASLLKDLNFNLSFNVISMEEVQEQISTYYKILKAQPKLKSIRVRLSIEEIRDDQDIAEVRMNINALSQQYTDVLNKCLKSSAQSLRYIENFVCLLNLPGLKIPPLPRIKLLSLYNSDLDHPRDYVDFFEDSSLFFPACPFSDVFPNLESIVVIRQFNGYDNHVAHLQERNIAEVVPHLQVKELLFWNPINPMHPGYMEYFTVKFPHLTSATFPKTIQFLEASQFIWTRLTMLEELRITITVGIDNHNNGSNTIENAWTAPFPSLEQAFTGFSRETCLGLLEMEGLKDMLYCDVISQNSKLEELRINSSILNLTRLKKLVISLDFWGNWDKSSPPIFTEVTGIFGFSLCPGLHVTLNVLRLNDGFDFRPEEWRPLSGIVPYVQEIRGLGRFR